MKLGCVLKGNKMKKTFLGHERPLITAMIACSTPEECVEKIKLSLADGADAIGVRLEWLKREYRTRIHMKKIFDACGDAPVYVTAYRNGECKDCTDYELAELLTEAVESGATMVDVMGDIFNVSPKYGISIVPVYIGQQYDLVDRIHHLGGEVLMSSYVKGRLSVYEYEMIASDQETRWADVLGIFSSGFDKAKLSEYFRVVERLCEMTDKKLQFEVRGEGIAIGDIAAAGGLCMYRCVQSHGEFDSPELPLIKDAMGLLH